MNPANINSNDINTEKKPIANPCVLVIFGIAGDLTKRLLYPSICNLGSKGLLNDNFCIVGVSIEKYTNTSFRAQLEKNIEQFVKDPQAKKFGLALVNKVHYICGKFSDHKVYEELKNTLETLEKEQASSNHLFYLAAPPEFMITITQALHKSKLLIEEKKGHFKRIIVEKPFGHDLASAQALNKALLKIVKEDQIFRIDHFLGKETVQNLLAFRFSNGIFEPIWNRRYIDHVQITVAETLGVEHRGSYYEKAGALRDMVPNHLFQLLSLITMEPPVTFSADYIRNEKVKALQSIPVFTPEQVLQQVIRGQYEGYRTEHNIAPLSSTETYVALKLFLNNWRWLHVPFYLRTGKRMKEHTSEIVIQFKSGPSTLFQDTKQKALPNLLRIYIQPDEGISLQFNAKIPGPSMELGQVDMKFKYSDYFGIKLETGYETILYDCMNGEHLLFKNAEMIELGWALVQPILDVWSVITPHDFPNYATNTQGPKAADTLLEQDGRKWLL